MTPGGAHPVASNTVPNVAPTFPSNVAAPATNAASLTQPLTSPIPTVKDQGGATLLSSPPVGNARTLSSAPAVVLPEPSQPQLPRVPEPARSHPAFAQSALDESSVVLPVRSNGLVYAIAAGVLALVIAGGVILFVLSRTAAQTSGGTTAATSSAHPPASSTTAASSTAPSAATSEPAIASAPAKPTASAATAAVPAVTGPRKLPTGHATTAPAGTPTTKPTSTNNPPPNPYAEPAQESH